jgi:hypothetical protein
VNDALAGWVRDGRIRNQAVFEDLLFGMGRIDASSGIDLAHRLTQELSRATSDRERESLRSAVLLVLDRIQHPVFF